MSLGSALTFPSTVHLIVHNTAKAQATSSLLLSAGNGGAVTDTTATNSIVLNALDASWTVTGSSGFFVQPIRGPVAGGVALSYNTGTGEITYTNIGIFSGGIKTNAITPATGTSLVIGGAGDTVTVPGNLVVTGTFTNPGGGGSSSCSCPSGIQTNTISPVTAGSTVTIPGSGPSSTAIGLSGECGMQSCN